MHLSQNRPLKKKDAFSECVLSSSFAHCMFSDSTIEKFGFNVRVSDSKS